MNYKQIRNPIWANKEYTVINCEVDFDDLIEEFVPFSATLTDKYPHVIEIFQKCVNGDFGAIQEYAEPIIPEPTQEELKVERKALIAQQLEVLTITTAAGNVFDANVQARLDISNAIMISDAVGITETVWRLADDSEVLVTIAELKEALMLALTEYARIKGIGA